MPKEIDPRLVEADELRLEEEDRTPSAIVPEHKRMWMGDERTFQIQTPQAAPLKQAQSQTALAQGKPTAEAVPQMRAEEPEKEGSLFDQWQYGRQTD